MAFNQSIERLQLAQELRFVSSDGLASWLGIKSGILDHWLKSGTVPVKLPLGPADGRSLEPASLASCCRALQVPIIWVEHGADPPSWLVNELVLRARWSDLAQVLKLGHLMEPDATRSTFEYNAECLISGAWRDLWRARLYSYLLRGAPALIWPRHLHVPRWKFFKAPFESCLDRLSVAEVVGIARQLNSWPEPSSNFEFSTWPNFESILKGAHSRRKSIAVLAAVDYERDASDDQLLWDEITKEIKSAVFTFVHAGRNRAKKAKEQGAVARIIETPFDGEPLLVGKAIQPVLGNILRLAMEAGLLGGQITGIRSAVEMASLLEFAGRDFSSSELAYSVWRRTGVITDANTTTSCDVDLCQTASRETIRLNLHKIADEGDAWLRQSGRHWVSSDVKCQGENEDNDIGYPPIP